MILPDVNLLIYAYNSDALYHAQAKEWWEDTMTKGVFVSLPWATVLGFIRLITNRTVCERPLACATALTIVESWLHESNVATLDPGPRHIEILKQLESKCRWSGKLSTDAHLAALAIEHRCELHSNDNDFDRFPGLRWKNPLR